jgi:peptidoglycan hydrolase-like protein with peptidoglycan-binding domain
MSRQRVAGRIAVLVVGMVITSAAAGMPLAGANPGVGKIGPKPSSNIKGVTCVQNILGIPADGKYGEETYHAVMRFQDNDPDLKAAGPDGAVGPLTGEKLLQRAGSDLQKECGSVVPSRTNFGGGGGDGKSVTTGSQSATCAPHVGNTQAWVDCTGGDSATWIRLNYVCQQGPGFANRHQTYTTEWQKLEAKGTRTISKECKQKVVSAKGEMRPF